MKKNTLVKYIGGQDRNSKKICPLKVDEIYTVKEYCQAKFGSKWKDAIKLVEIENAKFAFDISMFEVLQAPLDLSEILQSTGFSILNCLN